MSSDKIALDDVLVKRKLKGYLKLERASLAGCEEFERLNDELAFIEDLGRYYHVKTGKLFTLYTLKEGHYSNRHVETAVGGKVRMIKTVDAWSAWAHRRSYDRIVYEPDVERVNSFEFNTWQGWGCEPKRGNTAMWKKLMEFMFDGDPKSRSWFERWCAYPIQRPGFKMYTAAVFYSLAHGVGKSLVGLHLGRVYGLNACTITYRDLHSSFNWWAKGRQFILGEEITGSDRRKDADYVKGLITSEEIPINEKNQPNYSIRDTVNYLFTTNHPNAFYLENGDRRFFIHEVKGHPLSRKFYREYDKWYRSNEGASALFYHLRTLKLGDFDPRGPALATEAKEEMRFASQSALDDFAADIVKGNQLMFKDKVYPHTIITIDEACGLYDSDARPGKYNKSLGNALGRARVPRRQIRIPGLGKKRVIAVKDLEKWELLGHNEWVGEYARTHPRASKKKY